ncbi:YadA-like family protein [Bacillus sp. NP157]|nr:YadA-like family protein [Bacillus sp. NP157]
MSFRVHLKRLFLAAVALAPLPLFAQETPTCDGYVCTTPGSALTVGPTAVAPGQQGTAVGDQASAGGFASSALGERAQATGDNSSAFGSNARASGGSSTALGNQARASDGNAIAIGNFSDASAISALALGDNASASGIFASALGAQASASGESSTALGAGATATGANCVALGVSSNCTRDNSVDVGNRVISSVAAGTEAFDAVNVAQLRSVAGGLGGGAGIGPDGLFKSPTYNLSTGSYSDVGSALSALDSKPSGGAAWMSSSEAEPATAMGDPVLGHGNNLAVGAGAGAGSGLNQHNVAIGGGAQAGRTGDITNAEGGQATAIGAEAVATNLASTAVGAFAVSSGRYSTAIGSGAVADENYTVSFGHRAGGAGELDVTNRLVYISDGINPTDAMNMRQGNQIASWYGGGAEQLNGVSIAPMFQLSGGMFRDVNSALVYLDSKTGSEGGSVGPQGPKGDTGPQGPAGVGSGRDDLAVHYDDASQGAVTLGGSGGTAIHNLRAGTADTDAVNLDQLNRSAQSTLSQANAYADVGDSQTRDWAKAYTDSQIRPLNRRINQAGAVGSVIGGMALSAGSVQQQDKLSMGVASYRGQSAIGIGFVHRFENDRVAVAVGGAFAGEGSAVAVSVSIGLNH